MIAADSSALISFFAGEKTEAAEQVAASLVPLITADSDFRHFAKHCGLKLA